MTPNDFTDLDDVAERLLRFQEHYESIATPFEWKFTRADLRRLIYAALRRRAKSSRGGLNTSPKLRSRALRASWCLPYREEAPLLERTWRQYRDDGVIFLGVNIKDAESDAEAFVEEFDITYPVLRDLDQELTRSFGVRGLPETFFVDHEWRFVGTESGAQRGQQQGTVILGAITEDQLLTNLDVLVRRAAGSR